MVIAQNPAASISAKRPEASNDAPRASDSAEAKGRRTPEANKVNSNRPEPGAAKQMAAAGTNTKAENTLNTNATLFKQLSPKLQGLYALGIIRQDKDSLAKVIKSVVASPEQMRKLMPTLQAQTSSRPLNSAELIRQPPSLVKVELQGHQLLTVSRAQAKPGDTLALRLGPTGQLIAKPNSAGLSSGTDKAGKAHSSPIANGLAKNSAPAGVRATAQLPSGQTVQTKAATTLLLQDALRQSLPQQRPMAQLAEQFRNLQQQLSQLPQSTRLLDASSRLLVQQLSDKVPSFSALTKPFTLSQLLPQSGVLQEAHMRQLQLAGQDSQQLLGPVTLNNTKTQLGRLVENALKHLTKHSSEKSAGSGAPSSSSSTRSPAQTNTAPIASPAFSASSLADKPVQQLLALILGASPQSAAENQQSNQGTAAVLQQLAALTPAQRDQLRQALQHRLLQLGQAGLGKIQTQQLHMLMDPAPGLGQRWIIDIPFLFQDQMRSLELEIQERPGKRKAHEPEQSVQSQWQVRLALDLPELGALHVDIKLMEQRSHIQLWFEQQQALSTAKAQLSKLRGQLLDQGIEVEDLQCHIGLPPKLGTSMQYNLINTKA